MFAPQHCTGVSASSAQGWSPPAATAVASVMPSTSTGDAATSSAVSVPSCPESFSPQHHTVPVRMAQECAAPVATPVNVGTAALAGSGTTTSADVVRSATTKMVATALRTGVPPCPPK